MNTNTQSLDFKTISKNLLPSAAKLLATSFFNNPAHIYLCPDNKTRLAQLEWLLGLNLKLQLKHGAEDFCLPENEIVQAMGFWSKPNDIIVGTAAKLKGGLLKIPFKMGLGGFKRAMEVGSKIDEQLHRTMGITQSYRYLNNMVMQESKRGKGWGSRILEKQFDLIQDNTPNAVLALSTQRFWKVKFYERLGFEVILEEKIGTGPLAFTNWVMKKVL